VDTALFLSSIIVPPILAFGVRSRVRAVAWGTIWFWLVTFTAAQYHLAYDPEYDGMASGIAIVAGWFPGLIYSLICTLTAMVVTAVCRWSSGRCRTAETEERKEMSHGWNTDGKEAGGEGDLTSES